MNESKLVKVFEDISLAAHINDIEAKLPLAFVHRYEIKIIFIVENESTMVLIKEKRSGSIESFIDQAEAISRLIRLPYLLVFTEISSDTRSLLLKARIPFVDYKGNLFIPELGTVLNRIDLAKIERDVKFSPSEQAIFIGILLMPKESFTTSDISSFSDISVPTIYRALKKFSLNEWIESSYGNISFIKPKDEIFQEGTDLFINPKKKSIFIDKYLFRDLEDTVIGNRDMKLAGESALSQLTSLYNPNPIYALSSKKFSEFIKNSGRSKKSILDKEIGDVIELELWEYTSINFDRGGIVDPISLYLTLKDNSDPRVEMELGKLKEVIYRILGE